ncbi:MmgE/PrpD family protein [Amycolatopsis eburnea]|uniref:MmgE/PrpD family protein n=1 Tax=Amycolatopsis eburnea TaxID=2267691 RepID=A0A3R9KF61_9PSEU|nr:MmgE/PrpD family protein [Amycolatopsis eburnea]RSD10253.1 MmgE/PrpD family protein [Amycolatopsis eburnea]
MYLDELADQLSALASAVTDEHLERAGLCVLDALACVYGGRKMPWVSQARAVADAGGAGESAVWASGGARHGLADAVFANSVGCHSLLYEDTHPESRVHPGTVAVPAALGVGELVGASGADVLRAVVLGYEAMAQVARTALTEDFVARGWRASGVFGPFGAVAAAAYLFELDRATAVHALGIAAGSAAGVCEWAPAGTTEVFFQPASAARGGIVAVLLARAGATGAGSAVEGLFGLRRAFGGTADSVGEPDVTAERPAIDRAFFKAHPSCAFTQHAIDAAVRLHARGIDPGAVTAATIHTSAAAATYPGCDNADSFATPIARQMSLQFGVAAALTDGRLVPSRYEGAVDAPIAALAARTRVVIDPEYDRAYPGRLDARVELALAGGETAVAASAEHVDLPPAGVFHKFRTLAAPALGEQAAGEIARVLCGPGDWAARDLVARLG